MEETACDSMIGLDRDNIVLEILTGQIIAELGDIQASIENYKQSISFLKQYNDAKELISKIVISRNRDDSQKSEIVRP